MRRLMIAGICVVVGWPACAEPVALGGETLKQAIAGKTVHLDTPLGVAIPITYHGNGLMSGKAGVLETFLGAEADRGRWWVADGKLCQKWFKWLDAQPSCMQLRRDGDRIFWRRNDGMSGTAKIASALPPGAEAAPGRLGGPVPTAHLSRSLTGEQPGRARVAEISTAPSPVRHDLNSATPRAIAVVTQPRPKQRPSDVDRRGKPAVHGRLTVAIEPLGGAWQDDRWCHSDLPAAIATNTAPGLLIVARLAYAGSEWSLPTSACLAAEPVLRQLARLGAAN
jgi:hypothetical protein